MSTQDQLLARDDFERRRDIHSQLIAHFLKRYRPKDPYDAEDFERDIYSLISLSGEVYAEPILRQIRATHEAVSNLSLRWPAKKDDQ